MPTPSSPDTPDAQRPAALLIVAGPTCSGKDTLLARLLEERPELGKPITTTTRPPRDTAKGDPYTETPGVPYHFLAPEEFIAGRDAGGFVESALVHGQYYGLSRAALDDVRSSGRLPAVILDVQGAQTVSSQVPTVRVFIQASTETIERRLRANRPADQVAKRMASLPAELEEGRRYDLVIDNEDGRLDESVQQLVAYYDTVARARLRGWTPEMAAASGAQTQEAANVPAAVPAAVPSARRPGRRP